jgi:hypothetical protein
MERTTDEKEFNPLVLNMQKVFVCCCFFLNSRNSLSNSLRLGTQKTFGIVLSWLYTLRFSLLWRSWLSKKPYDMKTFLSSKQGPIMVSYWNKLKITEKLTLYYITFRQHILNKTRQQECTASYKPFLKHLHCL